MFCSPAEVSSQFKPFTMWCVRLVKCVSFTVIYHVVCSPGEVSIIYCHLPCGVFPRWSGDAYTVIYHVFSVPLLKWVFIYCHLISMCCVPPVKWVFIWCRLISMCCVHPVFQRWSRYSSTVMYHVLCSHGDFGSRWPSFTMCCVPTVIWVVINCHLSCVVFPRWSG